MIFRGMSERPDPRVFLASERTLLAWVRTGLATMGLGFVVAKFGLFLAAAGFGPAGAAGNLRAAIIGIALVITGGVAVVHAARQHQRLAGNLGPAELPRHYSLHFAPWFAYALAAASAILAIHLLLRATENEFLLRDHPGPRAGQTEPAE